jgi:hypothetical protein
MSDKYPGRVLTVAEELAAKAKQADVSARAATAATAEHVPQREKTREELMEEVQRLTRQLEDSKQQAYVEAQSSGQRARYLGETVERDVVGGEDRERATTLWEYTIDLPPSGGTDIKLNGIPFYHGQTYRVTKGTLDVLRDQVSRSWQHEANIRGSNENAYRRPRETTFSMGRRA